MGSRGASSGIADNGKIYGTEYHSVLEIGNIKFVVKNDGKTSAPLETMTKGRVYVTINPHDNVPQYISYYDVNNKRSKTIDLRHEHRGVSPHTHHGYNHNENDTSKGFANPTTEERKMIERVMKIWDNKGA